MKRSHTYHSMLRVPYRCTELCADELAAALDGGAFDSVAFFNMPTHDIVCEARHRANAAHLKPHIEAAARKGLAVGIDVLSTVGHHEESADPAMDGMDFLVHADGRANRGVLCPTSEKTLDAVRRQYAAYAELPVDFLYVDDDMDYHCECYCDRCIAAFEARYGDMKARGLAATRENLVQLLGSPDRAESRAVRAQWLDFYTVRAGRIFEEIASAVRAVRPDILLGLMPCEVGTNGCGQDDWSETLSAGSGQLLCRPGGGLYTDFRPDGALEKAHKIARELRYIPAYAFTQSEIENYPQQSLRKSAHFTVFEAMLYSAAGCTGTAYNILSSSPDAVREAEPFVAAAGRVRPFITGLARTFGRNPAAGVGCRWDKGTFAEPETEGKRLPFEDSFYSVGLPVCYEPDRLSVTVVNAFSAAAMPDAAVKDVLSGGVYLDAGALGILCARGYGRYLGFTKGAERRLNAVEVLSAHPLNPSAGLVRDAHLEFSLYGHPEFDRGGPACTIVPAADTAAIVSELRNYGGERVGAASGVFVNELGGRVYVDGYAPYSWQWSLARTAQLKNIFRWLSGDTLPAYVASHAKAALWQRDTTDGRPGAIVANLALDRADLTVMLRGTFGGASFVLCDGTRTKRTSVRCRPSGAYTEIALPQVPPLSVGYIVPAADPD